jgi:hypothetical protein
MGEKSKLEGSKFSKCNEDNNSMPLESDTYGF